MPFQLTIAEGKESGRQFVFEQPQVVIGRTTECDVVLYDPGVSRQHARIFHEGDGYFVEDMGSSNGTKVNGSIVKKHKLSDGDAVSLGPVVFNFTQALAPAPGTGNGTDPGLDVQDQGTRILQVDGGQVRPVNNRALQPADADDAALGDLERSRTRSMEAVKRASLVAGGRTSNRVSAERTQGLSAAERARIRRESPGLGGSLKIIWLESSAGARFAFLTVCVLLVLGGLGAGVHQILSDSDKPKLGPEPQVLTRKPIESSFGLGDGVDYSRPDMKVFDFQFVSATRAVVLLHFQAKDVSEGEVVVTVNGADVGRVPPDQINANDVSHEILIPPELLKKGQKNKIIFDNVRNPPGSDPWRIWNIWTEVVPLPELSLDDLLRDATTAYQRGQMNLDRRDVGANNRYEAWKEFRNAWLMLESYPNPKPELYVLARAKVREAQLELDRECAKLMLEAESYYNHKDYRSARGTLDHVKDFFPANDQACWFRAEQKRFELDL